MRKTLIFVNMWLNLSFKAKNKNNRYFIVINYIFQNIKINYITINWSNALHKKLIINFKYSK